MSQPVTRPHCKVEKGQGQSTWTLERHINNTTTMVNPSEIKITVYYNDPIRRTRREWHVGASGDVTLNQLVEMAAAYFGLILENNSKPKLSLKYNDKGWIFASDTELRRLAGFAASYDLEFTFYVR